MRRLALLLAAVLLLSGCTILAEPEEPAHGVGHVD